MATVNTVDSRVDIPSYVEDEDVEMTTAASSANILEVPLEADGEAVTIDLDNDLPEDPSEICVLLENEKCAAEYWLAIGTAYCRNGQVDNGVEVCTKGLESSIIVKDSDRIPFYCCLAWMYLKQLRKAPNIVSDQEVSQGIRSKADYHRLATEVGNKAYQLDRTWTVNILARGALTLAVGNTDEALMPFQTVLNQSGDANLFAQMGKARVLYHKKNYKGALKWYQSVLEGRPSFKPDPRIGIGLCFWQLNDKAGAQAAWERALELSPNSIGASTLLGLFYMEKALGNVEAPSFASDYAKAMSFIQAAYKNNSNYPSAALVLATYMFSKKNMDGVLKLTEKVVKYSDVPSLISDGYFWMGRAYHYTEDYDKALYYYQKAEENQKTSILPMVGKGLVQMAQDSPEALLTFESITNQDPKFLEAILLLGLLTAKRATNDPKRRERAIFLLERYLNLAKDKGVDPASEALLTLAQLNEETNTGNALKSLSAVLKQIDDSSDTFLCHLHNNIGVLHYLNGNFEGAKSSFEKASELISDSNLDIKVTVDYNLARLDDATGKPDEARTSYKTILEQYPGYIDAKIRLAYLDVALNEPGYEQQMLDIIDDEGHNMEVRALYGWYLKRQKRAASKSVSDDAEQKHYKKSLVEFNKHDGYSLVALGNLYLTIARETRITRNGDVEKREKAYFKASEFFDKALQIDPNNVYAAQGIAIIFAETKRHDLALHIFTKIRETLHDISIYINCGHCLVDLKQYSKAIEAYEYALNRFKNGSDPQLFTLLGRAWYARAVSEKSIQAFRSALECSKKAFELAPENLGLKFNVAFIQFQLADFIRRVPESERTAVDIEEAINGLEEAIVSLTDISKEKYPPFPASELEQRAVMGQNTVRRQLERANTQQKEYEQQYKSKLEEAKKKRQELQEQMEADKKRKEEENIARAKALADERAALQEEARKWAELARQEAERDQVVIEENGDAKPKKKAKNEKKTPKKAEKDLKPSTKSSSKYKSEEFVVSDNDIGDADDYDDDASSRSSSPIREAEPGNDEGDEDLGLFGDEEEPVSKSTDESGNESEVSKKRKSVEPNSGEASSRKRRQTKRVADSDEE